MALVAIVVSALLLADFTPESQSLETFRFELVVEIFRAAYFGFRHRGFWVSSDVDSVANSCSVDAANDSKKYIRESNRADYTLIKHTS